MDFSVPKANKYPFGFEEVLFLSLVLKRPEAQEHVKYSLTAKLKVGLQGKRTQSGGIRTGNE